MEQASAEAKTMRLEAVCRLYSGFLCTAASHSIAELDFSLAARQLEIRKQSENDVETASVSSHTSNQSSISQSSRASSRSSFSVGSSALSSRSGNTGPRPSPSSTATSCVSLRDLESRKVEIERELERVQQELEERRRQERLAGIGERTFARQPSSARIESITSRKPS